MGSDRGVPEHFTVCGRSPFTPSWRNVSAFDFISNDFTIALPSRKRLPRNIEGCLVDLLLLDAQRRTAWSYQANKSKKKECNSDQRNFEGKTYICYHLR